MFTMVLSLSPTIWGNHRLDWGRWTHVMGIINVTPDSFSGDGLLENTDRPSQDEVIHDAVTLALQWVNEGPVIIAVGVQSTRPAASTLSLELELAPIIHVIRASSSALPGAMT